MDAGTTDAPASGSPQCGSRPEATVVVGTSEHAKDKELVAAIVALVGKAYVRSLGLPLGQEPEKQKTSESEIRRRLCAGDEGEAANRVLHLVFLDGVVAGCASSSITTPWTSTGCGHWGYLYVSPALQGQGAASALVGAAERRLREAGCENVRIEYEYSCDNPNMQMLEDWYEGKLGFQQLQSWPLNRFFGMIFGRGGTQFRPCQRSLQ